MNRQYLRVTALALFLYLAISPVASAAPRRERGRISDPGEQIVRIVKKVTKFFRGFTTHDDDMTPPRP